MSRNCKKAEQPFGRWVEHSRIGQTCHSFRLYSENNGNIWWVYGRSIVLTQVGTGWKWVYWRIRGVSIEGNMRNSIASGKRIGWQGNEEGMLCYGKINFWGWCDDFTVGNKTGRMCSLWEAVELDLGEVGLQIHKWSDRHSWTIKNCWCGLEERRGIGSDL